MYTRIAMQLVCYQSGDMCASSPPHVQARLVHRPAGSFLEGCELGQGESPCPQPGQRESLEPAWLDAKCLAGVLGMGSMAERFAGVQGLRGLANRGESSILCKCLDIGDWDSHLTMSHKVLPPASKRPPGARAFPLRATLLVRGHLAKEDGHATQFNLYAGSPLTA
jgi:hypothetical protein